MYFVCNSGRGRNRTCVGVLTTHTLPDLSRPYERHQLWTGS